MLDEWVLTVAVFAPLAGAGVIAALPKGREAAVKMSALVASGVALVAGVIALARFDFGSTGEMQLGIDKGWIDSIGARYHMGVDGIALPLLLLTVLLTFLCVLYSQRIMPKPHKPKGFFALILLLETGMAGTFTALDLVLFFVFWELVLVPMYFLIAVWGSERKEYSAIKFFLYTLFGSVFMLLGFLAMYFRSVDPATGKHTFDMLVLQHQAFGSPAFEHMIFLGLFLGFAIKVPMWPFHTWLPDAHGDAPTVGSVLLAGILLKMGTYGFIRIALPMLPERAVEWAPYIGALAVISILYGALNCLAQKDIKRLIAFSSVGHMGFVMLGIATLTDVGINAAVFGMVAHGIITGMLFFLAGSVYERYHTRVIDDIGPGMLLKLPRMGAILAFSAIASLGLPGLAGFWGEVLALLAAFNPARGLSSPLFRAYAVLGGVGTILTAGYFLWLLQRLNLGQVRERWANDPHIDDVRPVEVAAWSPLLVGILALGVYPRAVLEMTGGAVSKLAGFFS
ncbi:MAG: NADH-quinone oxidoreductase subunit M [Acidobacteria bacterium]|nr:NADH-quinone oxidoreductase subunit M [Acidobacteriota bacterium]